MKLVKILKENEHDKKEIYIHYYIGNLYDFEIEYDKADVYEPEDFDHDPLVEIIEEELTSVYEDAYSDLPSDFADSYPNHEKVYVYGKYGQDVKWGFRLMANSILSRLSYEAYEKLMDSDLLKMFEKDKKRRYGVYVIAAYRDLEPNEFKDIFKQMKKEVIEQENYLVDDKHVFIVHNADAF